MKPALAFGALLAATPALAETAVVTDSPIIQSLVAQVTGEVPVSIMSPGSDPHHFVLRPSQVRSLTRADWLIWVGPEFTPWLDDGALALNPDLSELRLGEADPHGWLDPLTAQSWAGRIAETLDGAAPDFDALTAELQSKLDALSGLPLIVGHNAYDSFAATFGLTVFGAIADSHAAAPGAAHLSELRAAVLDGEVACILSDNHELEGYVDLIAEGTDVPVVELDLSGQGLEPGASYYATLMRDVAAQLQGCLN